MNKYFFLLFLLSAFTLNAQQDSLNVHVIYHWDDPSIPGSTFYNNAYNECWGVTVNGRDYAIIGSTMGTHIFDVTDSAGAGLSVFIPGAVQGGNIVHRDFHDYMGYLYIVSDEGLSTLQIADLSFLPDSAPLVYNSSALFNRSHNIYIDTTTAKLYSFGGNVNNGIHVFDLSDPTNPVELVNYSMPETTHDGFARHDTLFVNDGFSGLFVYDMSNTANPVLIGSLTTYQQQGYDHSGWLSDDGTVYALGDETHGMDIKLLDVSDLSNITILDTVDSGIDPNNSIPHNIIIRGNYMYVSYYYDGFYVYDISDPSNVQTVGFYDTSPLTPASSYEGAWGVFPYLNCGKVVVSDMQEGLFVLNASKAINYSYLPSAQFTQSTNGTTVTFTANYQPGTQYSWYTSGGASPDGSGRIFNYTFPETGSYNVCLSALNACGMDSSCSQLVVNNIGDEEINLTTIRIYPNPTSGIINISSFSGHGYILRSADGRMVQDGSVDTHGEIDLSRVPSGLYILETKHNKITYLNKIIKF